MDCDVLVIGAGAAGLSALKELSGSGLRAICIEARDRIGGRILTVREEGLPLPIELGPEFIHGRPHETWDIVRSTGLTVFDCEENSVQIRDGRPANQADSWDQIGEVTAAMSKIAAEGKDVSFLDFIEGTDFAEDTKRVATQYVEGFNAARKESIGVASLAQDSKAAAAIDGDRNFRIVNGYSRIAEALRGNSDIRLNKVVEIVRWSEGFVTCEVRDVLVGDLHTYTARCAIVTVPLGVLQARSISFQPEPTPLLAAADQLRFGHVIRMVMRFREAWWERIEHLQDAGFWLSNERYFSAWWTSLPVRAPLLVGWSAGPRADLMADCMREQVMGHAVEDLARMTGKSAAAIRSQLETASYHDWRRDPFALGAYSYVPAGAMHHRKMLAEPWQNTLFFAGEATEIEGHSATVHGAIATGKRAAKLVKARLAASSGDAPPGGRSK